LEGDYKGRRQDRPSDSVAGTVPGRILVNGERAQKVDFIVVVHIDDETLFDSQDADVENVVYPDIDAIFVVVFRRGVFDLGHGSDSFLYKVMKEKGRR
jgi:hypothetical protein